MQSIDSPITSYKQHAYFMPHEAKNIMPKWTELRLYVTQIENTPT